MECSISGKRTMIVHIRMWLIRAIAGRMPVALNLTVYGSLDASPAPALLCNNRIDTRGKFPYGIGSYTPAENKR